MKVDNLYIIGGNKSKLTFPINNNSKLVFFDKSHDRSIDQFLLIKNFKDHQFFLQEKWLNFQDKVFKKIQPLMDQDENYKYMLSNLFFEASSYKTNSVYQFFKLYLIISHIKKKNIKNIFLVNLSPEIELFFKNNSKILNLSIKTIEKKKILKRKSIKNYFLNSIFFQIINQIKKMSKKKIYKIKQFNKVVLCQFVRGSQNYDGTFSSKYFADVSKILKNNYSWLFHGVGKVSENQEYDKLINSNVNTYGFLNEYLSLNDMVKVILNFYNIKKKLTSIKPLDLFIFENINYHSLFKNDWTKSNSNLFLDTLFFEKKFENFFKKNSKVREILYLLEFHPWESMLNKVAKKFGVKTKGITHINVRPNLMQYYHSKLIYSYSYFPSLVGVNSHFCKNIFLKSGFVPEQLVEIEAHRYNYLYDIQFKSEDKKTKLKNRILITTSINLRETREMLEVFASSNINFEKIYIKEHPSLPINSIVRSHIRNFPSYEIVSGSISDAFEYSDIVYTANGSSTLLESVLSKKYTVTLLTLSSLPAPAFNKAPNLYFAFDNKSLSEIFKNLINKKDFENFSNHSKNDLYLNKDLTLWKKFLNL